MSRSSTNLDELASGKLGRLLLKYSWPALVAMTLNALYAVVDRVFIGQGCGVDAMAGLQLAMPVMMLFGAFGVFIGAGHSAALSIKLGERDFTTCEKLLGQLVAFKLAFFFILPPLVFFNLDTVLGWCGADKVTPGAFAAAKDYLRLVLFSHLFSHLAFGLSAMQRAEGSAIRSMVCMVVGFGLNLVLDPIFIFTFKLGIAGAAWATNIAMVASCLWAMGYYLRGRSVVKFRWSRIGFYRGLLLKPSAIGLAPFLQQLMSSIIVAALQLAFARWMPDEAARTAEIASLGVFNGALILIFMPILGCQQGLQPIFGYNWGARNFRRVRAALKLGFIVTTVLTFVAFVVQVIPPFPRWIAQMFISGENSDMIALATHDLQLSNMMIWCISINVLATTYFQSIGKPAISIWLSLLRQGVILLPIVVFLPYLLEDKAFAIWLSMPVSDVLCNFVTIFPFLHHMRFLRSVRSREKLDAYFMLTHYYAAALWGGDRLKRVYGRLDAPTPCSESWEISAHPRGMSVMTGGTYDGWTLADLTRELGVCLVGTKAPDPTRFPLLMKLIDARLSLSIQVHPNETSAPLTGGDPKTEAWYVVQADEGAKLYAGLKRHLTAAELGALVTDGQRLVSEFASTDVAAGDIVFIPGGTPHAIGAGSLIFEVQQTSDTTYRLYDWDRVGADGKPRKLHVEASLKSIDYDRPAPQAVRGELKTPFFTIREVRLDRPLELVPDGSTFIAVFILSGATTLAPAGTSLLIPAAGKRILLESVQPETRILVVTL